MFYMWQGDWQQMGNLFEPVAGRLFGRVSRGHVTWLVGKRANKFCRRDGVGREIAGSLLDLFSSGRQFRGVHVVPDSTGMMSLMKSYHIFI